MRQRPEAFDNDPSVKLDLSNLDLTQLEAELTPFERTPPGSPPAYRTVVVTLLVGAAIALLWLPRSDFYHFSRHKDWLFAAICAGATVVGLALGRVLWRWAEEAAERHAATIARRRRKPPRPLPPWLKWVNLLVLVGAGLFAATAPYLSNSFDNSNMRFALGGVGFVVGVLGAIWTARRFDETEKKLREQTRRTRRS